MKKLLSYVSLSLMLFILTACPYSSEFPLDEPNEKTRAALMGKWVEDGSQENPTFYMITKDSDKTYNFEKNEYDGSEKRYKKKLYTGHITKIGNVDFLNLMDKEDSKYYLHKIELKKGEKPQLLIFEVTDNIDEKFSNGAEMRAFFDKYKDLSFFYNRDEKKYNKE
ncbi:MAG: hypothetical protein OHK0045_01030 [Raineya sp.]